MDIILTDHAKKRFEERGVPSPKFGEIKLVNSKLKKQFDLFRRLKDGRVGYFKRDGHDLYLYICVETHILLIVTAYKYKCFYNKTGNRKWK